MSLGLYNNSASLFANHALKPLRLADGHIYHNGECVARCRDNEEAKAILKEAKYVPMTPNLWYPDDSNVEL